MGIISGLVSMLGWGVGDFLAAISSRRFGNFATYFWMQVAGFVVATIYFLLNFSTLNIHALPEFFISILAIAAFQVLAYLSFYDGLENGLVSIVSPLGSTFSAVTVVLSVIFYKEVLNIVQVAAIILIILSVVFISLDLSELNLRKVKVISGVKQGLIAAFGWGVSLFLLVKASERLGWFLPVYSFRLLAILMLILVAAFLGKSVKVAAGSKGLLLLLPVGLFDIGAFFSYSFGVMSTYASIVATVSGAFSVVTVLLAFLFLKERLKANQLVGVFGVLLGVILLSL